MGDLERDLDFLSSFNSERLLHRVKNDYCIKNDFLNNKLKEIKSSVFKMVTLQIVKDTDRPFLLSKDPV